MTAKHYLLQNRHSNIWYGRITIPKDLRPRFNGKREIKRSLRTADKKQAKTLSLKLWVQCQEGFERLKTANHEAVVFDDSTAFLGWLEQDHTRRAAHMDLKTLFDRITGRKKQKGSSSRELGTRDWIEFSDKIGNKFKVDFNDPEKEAKLALTLQQQILDKYEQVYRQDTPEDQSSLPETVATFTEAADLYIERLKNQGRKGKKLSQRTLLSYEGRLIFWAEYFEDRCVHDITLRELGEVQDWLPWLMPNYKKRKNKAGNPISTAQAISVAKKARAAGTRATGQTQRAVTVAGGPTGRTAEQSRHYNDHISEKTLAEYLGQLKGVLEFCHSRGFTTSNMAVHVEIPNTKNASAIDRLPFSKDDLSKIFPGNDYSIDFGKTQSGVDRDCKFWFPLLAVFTGARLEEIAQLKTTDIKTCPDTNIAYMMIDNKGSAGDGTKKHTKNLNSVRPIPIHSTLTQIGFMDYVEKRKQDIIDKSLFKLKRDRQGRLGKGLSNWFSRYEQRGNAIIKGYIEKRGVASSGLDPETEQKWSKTFHSFRHTVIDNLRGKKMANGEYIREDDIALVVGHEKGKLETANYGTDRMQLELRRDVVEAINYDGIAFEKINYEG